MRRSPLLQLLWGAYRRGGVRRRDDRSVTAVRRVNRLGKLRSGCGSATCRLGAAAQPAEVVGVAAAHGLGADVAHQALLVEEVDDRAREHQVSRGFARALRARVAEAALQ